MDRKPQDAINELETALDRAQDGDREHSTADAIRAHLTEARRNLGRIIDACGSHSDPGYLAHASATLISASLVELDLLEMEHRPTD